MRIRHTLPALCAGAVPFLAANVGHAKVPDPRFSEVPARVRATLLRSQLGE